MATLQVLSWKEDFVGFTGWDDRAASELKKRLRRAIAASPHELRRITSAAHHRQPFTLPMVDERYVESLRQILETMGAEVSVSANA